MTDSVRLTIFAVALLLALGLGLLLGSAAGPISAGRADSAVAALHGEVVS